jgi:hypothetical protein
MPIRSVPKEPRSCRLPAYLVAGVIAESGKIA